MRLGRVTLPPIMRLRPNAYILLRGSCSVVLVKLHQAIRISPGGRLDRCLIIWIELDSARGRGNKRKEHSSKGRELHVAMLKVKRDDEGKKTRKRVRVRARRKRLNVNERTMVRWALLSINLVAGCLHGIGDRYSPGEGAARPLQGLEASLGQGCFKTPTLIGHLNVSDVGLQYFERVSPPSESFIFGAEGNIPRIYWGSFVIHGDWHERPPVVLFSIEVAVTCGTSSSNNDRCPGLMCPDARAGFWYSIVQRLAPSRVHPRHSHAACNGCGARLLLCATAI